MCSEHIMISKSTGHVKPLFYNHKPYTYVQNQQATTDQWQRQWRQRRWGETVVTKTVVAETLALAADKVAEETLAVGTDLYVSGPDWMETRGSRPDAVAAAVETQNGGERRRWSVGGG